MEAMADGGTNHAVEQIRELIRQAAAAAEAIGPVFLARLDDPDGGLGPAPSPDS